MDEPLSFESLLESAPGLERSARRIVREQHLAADVVQDALLFALVSPPAHGSNPRGWLHAVVLNMARHDRRTSMRRSIRERRAARPEVQPDPLTVAESEHLRDLVRQAVAELESPYREVVELRYFAGLPPRRIAQEVARPLKTIKSQLHRGLKLLRERLRARLGEDERPRWRSLALLFVPSGERPERLARSLRVVTPTAAAAFLALGTWIGLRPRSPLAAAEPVERVPVAAVESLPRPQSEATHRALVLDAADPFAGSASRPAAKEVTVQATDARGTPLAGAAIERYDAEARAFVEIARTDAQGAAKCVLHEAWRTRPLEFSAPAQVAPLEAVSPRFALRARIDGKAPSDVVWFEEPPDEGLRLELDRASRPIRGRVVSATGAPLAGALVRRIEVERPRRVDGTGNLRLASPCTTYSDADGHFALPEAAGGLWWLEAELAGHGREAVRGIGVERSANASDAELELRIVLAPGATLRGAAVDSSQRGVPGGRVSWRDAQSVLGGSTVGDEAGGFVLVDLPADRPLQFTFESMEWMAREELSFAPGSERRWHPRLVPRRRMTIELHAMDGSAFAGQLVDLEFRGGNERGVVRARTDESGRLDLALPFAAPTELAVHAATALAPFAPRAELIKVPVTDAETLLAVVRPLATGGVRVVLRDESGAPCEGAVLRVDAFDGSPLRRARRNAGENALACSNVPPGEWVVAADWPGHGRIELGTVRLAAGEIADLGVRVAPAFGHLDVTWAVETRDEAIVPGRTPEFVLDQLLERGGVQQLERTASPSTGYRLVPGTYHVSVRRGLEILEEETVEILAYARAAVALSGGAVATSERR